MGRSGFPCRVEGLFALCLSSVVRMAEVSRRVSLLEVEMLSSSSCQEAKGCSKSYRQLLPSKFRQIGLSWSQSRCCSCFESSPHLMWNPKWIQNVQRPCIPSTGRVSSLGLWRNLSSHATSSGWSLAGHHMRSRWFHQNPIWETQSSSLGLPIPIHIPRHMREWQGCWNPE